MNIDYLSTTLTTNLSIIKGRNIPEIIRQETLPQLLAPSLQSFSEKTAFIFKDRSITYGELDNWSNAIAADLQQRGIGAGDFVGLWYPRSLELPVAVLGILKAGAAYVPLDHEMPRDRIQKVFTDIQVKTYFSDTDAGIHCPPITIPPLPEIEIAPVDSKATSNNKTYVLFTSGSTGIPKGIPISHGNICHLIRGEQEVLGIKPTDRVYQGFSISFDMWCEENWISLFAGATIWIADTFTVRAIDELSKVLTENGITILHAVPSVLAIIDEVPSLRIVNSGGEACTPQVLEKWSTPDRVFINSYGPTETTVTSHMAFLKKGDEITIGDPLPNYNMAVVDEQMKILPRGERGEMIITGPGVSGEYFNLPELTAKQFLPNPFPELPGDLLYKTGDAVLIRENGFLEFHGRFDDQIKLRGYRIELGEIENRLLQIDGVLSAAVAVKTDANNQEQLVGYVIEKTGARLDENEMRKQLAAFLAPYMVPVTIIAIGQMPRMPSGKINRKQLPVPPSFVKNTEDQEEHWTVEGDKIDEKLVKALNIVFPGKNIQLQDDFFNDLGGHSLLAATLVSNLRQKAGLSQASLKDIYENRPLQKFADRLKEKHEQKTTPRPEPYRIASSLSYYLCNLAQTVGLMIIFGLLAIEIIFPYISYYYLLTEGYGHVTALLSAAALYLLIPPVMGVLILSLKWLIVGKLREGDYPLWGWYYFRWWFWTTLKRLLPAQYLTDTPLYPKYLNMLGTKIHPSAQLSLLNIGAEDLLVIDENVSTSSGCSIDNATVENGVLKLRRVHLKANAYMGSSSVVCGGTVIEKNGILQDLSCLHEGLTIGAGEVWDGSPAQKTGKNNSAGIRLTSPKRRNKYALFYFASLFIFPLVVILPLFPTLYILYAMDYNASDYDFTYLWKTPFLALSYILLFILVIASVSRLLQRSMNAGSYSIFSPTYYKKWMKDQFMTLSLTVLHPLYASVYISFFYRMLGAKVGKNAEISTASDVSHHLLEIGEGSFIADTVILGEHEVKNETLFLERTKIGNNSFVGNSGLIPQGYHLNDNMLIGVLSKTPTAEQLKNSGNKDWFGSPAIGLPARERFSGFADSLTYHPSASRKAARALVEGLRIIIPQTLIIISCVLLIAFADNLLRESFIKLMLFLPLYYLAFMGLPLFLITLVLKWLLVGKYKPVAMPMYTLRVWISEAMTTFYEALCVPFLLDPLRGTLWLPFFLRMLGVKAGKKTWLNTTDITEFDMVRIGDEAILNEDCGPQTHLFEDRIMKIGPVDIGQQCTIGTRTIILYNSRIGKHVNIDSLSLVMKGEQLPDDTVWGGSPVRPL